MTETPPTPTTTRRPGTGVWPTLRASDAPALIRTLVEAFGFEVVVRYDDQAGGVAHAELAWPEGGRLMLGSVRDVPQDPWPIRPGSAGVYIACSDPEAVRDRAQGAGVQVGPLERTDYDSTEFTAVDTEGNRWRFGTYHGATG